VAEARVVIELWRRHYNEERPHSSLDYLTPAEFRQAYDGQQAEPAALRAPSKPRTTSAILTV
jgi:transposase InsO family protein